MNERQRKEVEEAIGKNPILCKSRDVEALLSDPGFHLETYGTGQVIFSPEQSGSEFALIVREGVRITKKSGDKTVFLKRAGVGDAFGAAGLFGKGGHYASTVTADARQTKIAMFSQDALERLFRREPDVAVAYVAFLSDRIRYLNEKIDSFSQTDSLVQLSDYLLKESVVECGMQKLAETLAISRATLYRQIAKLEERSAIEKDAKRIRVKDPEILKRIVKGE